MTQTVEYYTVKDSNNEEIHVRYTTNDCLCPQDCYDDKLEIFCDDGSEDWYGWKLNSMSSNN